LGSEAVSIAFLTLGELRKVDVASGTDQKTADVPNSNGGKWNRDGTILLSESARGLFRVAATGGDIVPVSSSEHRNGNAQRISKFHLLGE
jgi:hypothetical protein